ncbi:MAG: glycosyltransferase family 9 protein [Chloroherpetonaceae bacterium]
MTMSLKAIENANKAFWYKLLFKPLFRNKPFVGTLDISKARRLLLIRRDNFGDMVITSSFFTMLKDLNPNVALDLIASVKGKSVAEFDERLENVFAYNGGLKEFLEMYSALSRHKYDAILCLSFNGMTLDGLLANLLAPNAPKITTFIRKKHDLYKILFNAQIDIGKDDVAIPVWRQLRLFGEKLFGATYPESQLRQKIFLKPGAEELVIDYLSSQHLAPKQYVMLNISARMDYRKWGVENNVDLLKLLLEKYPEQNIIISAQPEDRASAEAILNAVQHPNVRLQPERFGLHETIALIKHSTMLISPDTANVHIAATFGVPCVILCTPISSGTEWIPLNVEHVNVFTKEVAPISTIPPREVFEAFDALWTRQRLQQAAATK